VRTLNNPTTPIMDGPTVRTLIRPPVVTGGVAFGGLLVFLFLVYANPGNWFAGLEDIGFAKIAAGFALAALGCSWLLYGRRLTIGGWPGAALCTLFVLVGFSALWSYWPRFTADTFSDGLKYLAIFLLVVNLVDSKDRLHYLISAFAFASLIPAFGAINSWAHGEHLVDGERAGWIGLFANPNDLAYYLVIGIAMSLVAREAASRRWMRFTYLAMTVPMGVALLLTQSRGGMLGAGFVLLLWVLRSVKRAPALIGVGVTLTCVLWLGPGDVFSRRMETSQSHGEDVSAHERLDAWRTGMNIASERPLTGVGAGAFMVAWPDFAPGDAGPARTAHNTFIQLVAELGFPGLLLFLFGLTAGVLGVSRAARVPDLSAYARGIQCGLAGFAVCSMTIGIAFSWPVYLLLGASFATARLERGQRVEVHDPARARLQLAQAGAA